MVIIIFTNMRNDENSANYMMLETLSSKNKKSCSKKKNILARCLLLPEKSCLNEIPVHNTKYFKDNCWKLKILLLYALITEVNKKGV